MGRGRGRDLAWLAREDRGRLDVEFCEDLVGIHLKAMAPAGGSPPTDAGEILGEIKAPVE
jgi:hypothetical protein